MPSIRISSSGEHRHSCRCKSLSLDDRNVGAPQLADTSVVRMRNWGQLGQLREANIARGRWVTVGDPCEICLPYDGREWEIAPSLERMDREMAMSPDEFDSYIRSLPTGVRSDPQAALEAGDLIPLHPNCHCLIVAVV